MNLSIFFNKEGKPMKKNYWSHMLGLLAVLATLVLAGTMIQANKERVMLQRIVDGDTFELVDPYGLIESGIISHNRSAILGKNFSEGKRYNFSNDGPFLTLSDMKGNEEVIPLYAGMKIIFLLVEVDSSLSVQYSYCLDHGCLHRVNPETMGLIIPSDIR